MKKAAREINYDDKAGLDVRGPTEEPLELIFGNSGAYGELRATIWLLERGYHVLRNISQHGPVDIVAIKDGVVTLFDVKSRRIGAPKIVRLTSEQIRMGVKGLAIFSDGSCEIDENPLGPFENELKVCPNCSSKFHPYRVHQIFCGHKCRPSTIKIRAERAVGR